MKCEVLMDHVTMKYNIINLLLLISYNFVCERFDQFELCRLLIKYLIIKRIYNQITFSRKILNWIN